MTTMTLSEAKATFSEVIDRVASGDEILITRMGKPIARITRFSALRSEKRLGFMSGQGWMADDYDDWPVDEASAFGITD